MCIHFNRYTSNPFLDRRFTDHAAKSQHFSRREPINNSTKFVNGLQLFTHANGKEQSLILQSSAYLLRKCIAMTDTNSVDITAEAVEPRQVEPDSVNPFRNGARSSSSSTGLVWNSWTPMQALRRRFLHRMHRSRGQLAQIDTTTIWQRNMLFNDSLPVSRLPTEILIKIFVIIVSEPGWNDTPLFALSRVCQRWRTVSIGYPLLWNTIQFYAAPDHILCMLERSRQTALTIRIGRTLTGKKLHIWKKDLRRRNSPSSRTYSG